MVKVLNVSLDYFRRSPVVSFGRSFPFKLRTLLAPAMLSLIRASVCASICGCVCASASAQYVGEVKKDPKDNAQLRAIAVLEWTGDAGKPKACRIVPVTIFDGEKLNDASLYMARPEPIALAGEVEYQLKEDGKTIGLFDIKNSGREQGSWVGYGEWKAPEKPKAETPKVVDDPASDEDDKPILHRKKHTAEGDSGASQAPAKPDDPDRPRLHKQEDPASSKTETDASDSDQPTLHRHSNSEATPSSTDSDRPKMKKQKPAQDVGHVNSVAGSTDPDRPRLQRGKSNADNLKVLPSLMGLPPDMEQAVAVSDVQNRPDHPWNYTWASPGDESKMKAQLEDLARTALGLNPPAPAKKTASQAGPGPGTRPGTRPTTRPVHKAATPPPATPPATLEDENFRVFELAYGSGATMVLTADTGGPQEHEKFVTIVAQPDLYGNVNVVLKNVTDGQHLDETPHMRLIDAVDVLADNRGELLFELRGETQRQFALYRVMRGRAEKLFSGSGGEYGSMTADQ